MREIRYAYNYICHLLKAKHTRGYGIHSPYLYRFTTNAVYGKNPFYPFARIEVLRESLKHDDRIIAMEDFGTGRNREIRVRDIAKTSLKRTRLAQMLFRIIHFTKAENVLELGTSLGITTAYLASPSADIKCISLEGSPAVAAIAGENFEKLEINNAKVKVGNIDETLRPALDEMGSVDVVFFDANHRKEPVLKYFLQCLNYIHPGTVFIFDDIHWSADMEKAWHAIRNHEKVTATFDLYEMGIVFFSPNFPKKNYKMALGLLE